MKKVLFASTALVLTAGVASAEITLSGSANMGIKSNALSWNLSTGVYGTSGETTVHNEIDIDVKGSGETDSGLTFGASVDLDTDSNNSANSTNAVKDPEVFIAYNGLKLTVGDVGEAQAVGGIADVGYDGIGIDDLVDDIVDTFGSDDVRVDYAFGDFAVAVSADSDTTNGEGGFAVGFTGSVDAFTFALGYSDRETGGTGFNEGTVTVGYSAGAIGLKATYSDLSVDGGTGINGFGVEASYTTGDVTLTAIYAENDADFSGFGVGFAYDLGGATLAGGVGQFDDNIDTETVADLGISFKF